MSFFKPIFRNPVLRYGLACLGAMLILGFLIVPVYALLGGVGFIFAQIVHWFVYENLGAKTPKLDQAGHLRRRRWDRSRRRARLAGH